MKIKIFKIKGSSHFERDLNIKIITKKAIRVKILSIKVPRFSKVYHIHNMRIK